MIVIFLCYLNSPSFLPINENDFLKDNMLKYRKLVKYDALIIKENKQEEVEPAVEDTSNIDIQQGD